MSPHGKPPALRRRIDRYLETSGVIFTPSHEVDNLGAMMSLIVSTGGIALLPAYARTFLLDTVATRPLRGPTPTIDLSVGYRKENASATLAPFLDRLRATQPVRHIASA